MPTTTGPAPKSGRLPRTTTPPAPALVHARTLHDHGLACWWCHSRLLPRKRR
ncbi:hypothetical protein I6J39_34480 (plasmid) [Streptomyces californicus]|uniref:Uncharacterized protein n=1 Tax=Streptomyces californicus TaxID=67351 RepID=A0ABX7JGS3_9ACTN|nr:MULTISPECIES: hypothetical protein [Streptomyces]QRV32565.1 hypothetical protein I6J39_34480 [Streptomyces californicus]QRV45995.1 hypothetical protein I6J41_34405 [Streptomyces californicus]